jgi:hypothetical protein
MVEVLAERLSIQLGIWGVAVLEVILVPGVNPVPELLLPLQVRVAVAVAGEVLKDLFVLAGALFREVQGVAA